MSDALDILLTVPIPTTDSYFSDPKLRQAYAPTTLKILAAASEMEAFVGRDLGIGAGVFARGSALTHRSLTSIALCTPLEREGLRWACIDPSGLSLSEWRTALARYRHRAPRCVAISTTYFITAEWLTGLIRIIREFFPGTCVLAGGYMYGTSSREFLKLEADLLCVGEGEVRLPQIIKTLRDGGDLTRIKGLYIRQKDGSLRFTGPAEPLELKKLELPDWSLAPRIDPPVHPDKDAVGMGVETQRGCVFKCQFCTFRTLTVPNVMEPEQAVEAILNTRTFTQRGHIFLADATATFPRERWNEIMRRLAEKGGSPHPLWAFARVSDLTPEGVQMMVRANVGAVFIGQESGDPGILLAMKKGTHLDHVKPAVAALANTNIHTTFGFIHGFPSETAATMQRTRDLICTLNDGFEKLPPVQQFVLAPFSPQDLAAVAVQERLQLQAVPTKVAVEETLATFIASARIRHAPASDYIGFSRADSRPGIFARHDRYEMFWWTKALQRGVAMFLEAELDGKRPDLGELKKLKEQLEAPLVPARWLERSMVAFAARKVTARLLGRLHGELDREDVAGPGTITRTRLVLSALRDSRRLRDAVDAWRGEAPQSKRTDAVRDTEVEALAKQLVTHSLESPERWLKQHKLAARQQE